MFAISRMLDLFCGTDEKLSSFGGNLNVLDVLCWSVEWTLLMPVFSFSKGLADLQHSETSEVVSIVEQPLSRFKKRGSGN